MAERKEKKERARKEKSVKKINILIFVQKKSEIKNAYFSYMLIILLVYKETYFNTNDLNHYIFSFCVY